ncbi:MAG: aldehyde dehydrogenase family protein [Planctomycetota bacterium]
MTTLTSHNPATGDPVYTGPIADDAAVRAAVDRARAAQPAWAATPADDRRALVRRFAERVDQHKDDLAALITQETGKLPWDAATEAAAVVAKAELSIHATDALAEPPVALPAGTGQTILRPLGVVAVLGPFNFPAHLPNGQIIPALLAGNAVVFKPSDKAPAVAEWLANQWQHAGLPDDLLQVIQGAVPTAEALIDAPVNAVLFTGSHAAGQAIHRRLAGRLDVLLALELGGNNPLVVHPDADPAAAAYHAATAAFAGAGQRCNATRRLILVDSPNTDAQLNALLDQTNSLRVGLPTDDPAPFVGPLINQAAADATLAAQQSLIDQGAIPLRTAQRDPRCPALLSPAILDTTACTALPDEETFGPLLTVTRAPSLDAAYTRAADTRFGLAAALLGGTPDGFARFAARVPAGNLIHNGPTTGASGKLPFGGLKHSGNHRPAGYHVAQHVADPTAQVTHHTLTRPEKPLPGTTN